MPKNQSFYQISNKCIMCFEPANGYFIIIKHYYVSQLPVVRSEHVRTLFDSAQSQESKSDIGLRIGIFKSSSI